MRLVVRSAVIVFLIGIFAGSLSAQKMELTPNAGGFFPMWLDHTNNKFKAEGIYGLKGGVFLNDNAELEGSFGYINHFELKYPVNGITSPSTSGVLYDLNVAYNFGQRQFLNTRVSPFVSAGVGGLTAEIRNADSAFIESSPARSIVMNSGDTFFTVNYGAGVKALNLWGPMGLRLDVRGRTLPNFFGRSNTWLEPTAGVIFSWGER